MKKRNKIIAAIIIIAIVVTGTSIFYMPIPVLDLNKLDLERFRKENPQLHVIIALYQDEYGIPKIEDPNVEEAIISYLSTCKMRRTLFKKSDWDDLEFVIHGVPDITLKIDPNGVNAIYSIGWFDYKLLNPDEALETLREIVASHLNTKNNSID